ncbi:hypothetical protein B0J12DRAFT_753154 [Macrophomina phaseolina]|uniref:Heat shock protein Hsp70 n=1 Tax=Macrophomina phaseolina TaxID=35725 RepID=A0ABQ8FSH1_9PEZI|nr:hypothetical protein B0J12DRAFT_753154 [Macrophomina phaseolina]
MSFVQWTPDVVIGIDFGMTCTGVAYSTGPEWPDPKPVQQWPGEHSNLLANKVVTAVSYDDAALERPASWGFLAEDGNSEFLHRKFKLALDPSYTKGPYSHDEARRLFRDYLRYMYDFLHDHFASSDDEWSRKKVEYVFSVPTTWKDAGMISKVEASIREAGFGGGTYQRARISLSEAEAAAVCCTNQRRGGDIFMVCDAGGGTTDLNTLKVVIGPDSTKELKPVGYVEGNVIGSTLIDFAVEKIIEDRLRPVEHLLGGRDPADVAEEMVRGKFQRFKHSLGSHGNSSNRAPELSIRIPDLPPGQDHPQAKIRDSKIKISRTELQGIFDAQIAKLFKLIDEQLTSLQNERSDESVSFIVLSGGLGSSPYLRKKMIDRYENAGGTEFSLIRRPRVLCAENPQLVVCNGLVLDRIQELRSPSKQPVIRERFCRASYGIVCRERYDPKKHINAIVVKDARDGQKWAQDRIEWLIKRGAPVSVKDGINRPFTIKFDKDRDQKSFSSRIVVSHLPRRQLPDSMASGIDISVGTQQAGSVKDICVVRSLLHEGDMKLKNRHWYQWKPRYWRARFDLKVLIGSADLRFEIWHGGARRNGDEDSIQVEFGERENPLAAAAEYEKDEVVEAIA